MTYILVKPKEMVCLERAEKAADLKYGGELLALRTRYKESGAKKHKAAVYKMQKRIRAYKIEMNRYFLDNYEPAADIVMDPAMVKLSGLSSAASLLKKALEELG